MNDACADHDALERQTRDRLRSARLVVLKVGSGVLAPEGRVRRSSVEALVDAVAGLRAQGRRVALVSSGAIAAGFREVGYPTVPATVVEKQAAAAVGQMRLMSLYADAFAAHDPRVAQVLLTAGDLEDRTRALTARRMLFELLGRGCVPIVNENDSVAFEEICFGDNDRLSALVSGLLGAEALALLSVADALRTDGGRGEIIPCASDPGDAASHAADAASPVGVGGMRAKLEGARIATRAGAAVAIAGGARENIVRRLFAGERVGTVFPPARRRGAKWGWIAHAARPRGRVLVDDGAVEAVTTRGASLLPAGVVGVEGAFERGEVIEVVEASTGRVAARGIVEYAASETRLIAGRRAAEIEGALGYRYADELVHRDDLTVLASRRRAQERNP